MATIANVAPATTILSAWGNAVATELNTRTLKVDGLRSSDGTPMQMTGDLLLRNASPTNPNHAARKQYVDDRIADRLPTAGGTLTGTLTINPSATTQCLVLRTQATGAGGSFTNAPYLSFANNSNTVQFGYIRGTPSGLIVNADAGDITLNAGGGQVRSSAIYAGGPSRIFGSGASLTLAGPAAGTYLAWYGAASSADSLGTRSGWVGYSASNHLQLRNEEPSSTIILDSPAGLSLRAGGEEIARVWSSAVMIGKMSAGIETPGLAMFGPTGDKANGLIRSTITGGASTYVNHQMNRLNSAGGESFVAFQRNGVTIGSVRQNGTTGVTFETTSDYRAKTVVGPIVDATDRVMRLRPYRVTWNDDPARGETDGLVAHEVAEVVPAAVSGDKDGPEMQGLAYGELVAVTIAALQATIVRVDALEGVG